MVSEKVGIMNPNQIISAGTAVVIGDNIVRKGEVLFPEGAVGIIVESPADHTHAYHICFPDGTVYAMKRNEFAIQKLFRREGFEDNILKDRDLYQYVIYRCVIGSRAYGLDHEGSDIDLRGIYLPPADMHWSLYGIPEQLEEGESAYWELQKFLKLALKANPNILECLYTPRVEYTTPLADELRDMREVFLTKLVYQTYNGYVMSQFRKLKKHREKHGTIKWKHAMHLIRLLLSGITALKDGYIPVDVGDYRYDLLAIRHEQRTWDEVNVWRLELHKEFDALYPVTTLPDRPDYDAVNAYLIKARRSMF